MGISQQGYLQKLYANRFDPKQRKAKLFLWKTLIKDFLQKHIDSHSITWNIGRGYCEFINNIKSREKYLIDLNLDAKRYADPDVSVLNLNVLELSDQEKIKIKFDIIFISNFFEHLANKEEFIEVLSFCYGIFKLGGSLLVIQPKFIYSYKEYYDFIDHQLPITHLIKASKFN